MANDQKLFEYVNELLHELDREYTLKRLVETEYRSKVKEICDRYEIAEGMRFEKAWREWQLANADSNAERVIHSRSDIREVEKQEDDLVGAEVETTDRGRGTIIDQKNKLITVKFDDNRTITYQLDTALRCRSLRFIDEDVRNRHSSRSGNCVLHLEAADDADSPNSLAAYLDLVNSAKKYALTDCLFSQVVVIRSDDDVEYIDILSAIRDKVFGLSNKKILQHSIVNGVRRWDASVENMFKCIHAEGEGILSINIREFSAIDPIFVEIIQSIRAASASSKKIFAIRIKEHDESTARLIEGKLPVFEIRPSKKTADHYVEKLYRLFPENLRSPFVKVREPLRTIIAEEMRSSSFTGMRSLEHIALKVTCYTSKHSETNRTPLICDANLSEYCENIYRAEAVTQTALEKLKSMLGMERIVDIAEELIAGSYQEKVLVRKGIHPEKHPRHIVFRGPSGCGKTTAARLLSKALQESGICHGYYEANARELCGRYLGETKYNTMSAIQSANDGVLFLDEAYALSIGDEYGAEAISTLLTAMESSNLIIIFAGYGDEMEQFLNSNPGLKSRIGYTVDFKPYDADELFQISMHFLADFEIDSAAKDLIRDHFNAIPQATLESPNFGLARVSRNIAMKIKSTSARRHYLADDGAADISVEDVQNALSQLPETEKPKQIGFVKQ